MPGPATALRGVEEGAARSRARLGARRRHVERYWRLEPGQAERTDEEWLELVRETVGAAVRRRLVADVPLGALLSGGIDSSIVVALMAQASGEPVRTFTVGFADARYDEREYARAVAERYGTRHEELEVEPDAAALLPRVAWAFDEPFGDEAALPSLLVSELARRARHGRARRRRRRRGLRGLRALPRLRAGGALGRVPVLPGLGARALRALPSGRAEPRSPAFRAARLARRRVGSRPTSATRG